MLNIKQEICKYQLFKSFDQNRRGNRTQVYRTAKTYKYIKVAKDLDLI